MADLLDEYAVGEAWDEMFDVDGHVRPSYRAMHDVLRTISPADLGARAEALASGYTDQGVTFDIGGVERPFPLDVVPRVIASAEWETIEAASPSGSGRSRRSSRMCTDRCWPSVTASSRRG